MSDYLVRGTAFNGFLRVFAVRTTDTLREIQRRLDTWPIVSAALGRTLSVGAMMGAMLKGEDRLTIVVRGGGPVGQVVVHADTQGKVSGYVTNPHVHYDLNDKGKLDVARVVGNDGTIIVTKDLGLKEPYQSSSPIVSGEIGEDFTYYFAASEQTPSSVGVGVYVENDNTIRSSGGFIIQVLPNTPEDMIKRLEDALAATRPISTLVDEGLTPEQILEEVLGEEPNILDRHDVVFDCHCSRDRIERALISLGEEELTAMIEEDNGAEMTCQFCKEVYHVSKEELEELRTMARK
jgi:molecular chaperone Hsp33